MAIGAGSSVALKSFGLGSGPALPVSGPIFGIVESGSDPYVVQWPDRREAAVAAVTINEILAATGGAATTKFLGQRVRVTTQTQAGYGLWRCIRVYNRAGSDVCLLQNDLGAFDEQAPASLTIVP